MPLLVHFTAEKTVKSIMRAGIRPRWAGVYCMPVLQDYYISHQWLREMRRHRPGRLVAVYFRISSQELVRVGHYSTSLRSEPVTLAQAIHTIMTVADPQGYEIVIPRSIVSSEIHAVRHLRQITGWRYMPNAHGRPFCTCPSCIPRGQVKGSKLHKYYVEAMRTGKTSWIGREK